MKIALKMSIIRTNITPFDCIADVQCGDDIEVIWGNQVRNLGVSAFQRGVFPICLQGSCEGLIKKPLVGFCWNMIKAYDSSVETEVDWANYPLSLRFQPAYPYYHIGSQLFVGNFDDGSDYGTYENDNGIHGRVNFAHFFENSGYNKVHIEAMVRRGERYETGKKITKNGSFTQIVELNDAGDVFAYRQHIQCFYCIENPSGSGFPPIKFLLFDDSDCPVQTETFISKDIPITLPTATQGRRDYIIIATWYEVNRDVFRTPRDRYWWVNNTAFNDWEVLSDGVFSVNLQLYKECT
jgi:hypothetical protein